MTSAGSSGGREAYFCTSAAKVPSWAIPTDSLTAAPTIHDTPILTIQPFTFAS
jgi:hypothetical protein